ncbi:OmpA family protein [Hymenobacter daecheongensis DSM 21074]|uniref:OmpA family protein n=1 Tax=Hymenobacter daecheongensis DSM 21074 TaxID=1121955 RepID=A0A1M6GYC4_9BACT|nr:OmpA family protein [Hymenobacter daecheongensis]SHJ14865.1 OmpA family protein [Hymenobacter daecheongensis DSM 21074]
MAKQKNGETQAALSLEELEKTKLAAEISKLEAERRKLDADNQEVQKRLDAAWYANLGFLQTLISGVLGLGAFLGLFKLVLEPVFRTENIEATLQIAEKKRENHKKTLEIDSLTKNIKQAKINLLLLEKKITNQRAELGAISRSLATEKDNLLISEKRATVIDGNLKLKQQQLKQKEVDLKVLKSGFDHDINLLTDMLVYMTGNSNIRTVDSDFQLRFGTVFFEYDKKNIPMQEVPKLQALLRILQDNPSFKVQLKASFAQGVTKEYAQNISEVLAESIKKYLSAKGIERDRIVSISYGSSSAFFDFSNYRIVKPSQLLPFNRSVELLIVLP